MANEANEANKANKRLLSMTGFSRKSKGYRWGTLNVEISSVNHRYQEISVRLPRELSSLEPAVISKVRSKLGRGKIRLSAEVLWNPEYKMAAIDSSLLAGYWRQLRAAADELGCPHDIPLTGLLSLPGVCDTRRDENIDREAEDALISALDEAADSLTEMKAREGESLVRDISLQLDSFSGIIDAIGSEWQGAIPEALAASRARLERFLAEAAGGVSPDPARLAQEIAILSDKWDVSEEIVRSRSHIEKFRGMMADGSSAGAGRKLDFLVQEMNREINTMGSKMQNAELRWRVVEAKACLERIREQIQNID